MSRGLGDVYKRQALRIRLQDFLRRIQARYDYQEVMCPPIGNKLLYITSGHYAKYGKDSFQPIHTPEEGEEYFLKPMNCPHHCMIYKNSPRSYKDLPLRLAEFGTVCRYEQSGELHGLTRVRSFTQDDAHIFCRPDQVKDEFLRVMDIISIVFESMDFENFEAQISLRDKVNREKYIGSDENWEKAERAIIEACEVTPDGKIYLTAAGGIAPTVCRLADQIIVELNAAHSKNAMGLHDVYEPLDPPYRREIPIYKPSDRIGQPYIQVDPKKIVGIVETNWPDEARSFADADPLTDKIGQNVADFLAADMKRGIIPSTFLPLQSGVCLLYTSPSPRDTR